MPVHFSDAEMAERARRASEAVVEAGLDAADPGPPAAGRPVLLMGEQRGRQHAPRLSEASAPI